MPAYVGGSGREGGGGGGVIYVDALPDASVANPNATYGVTADDPVSLWRITTDPTGTVTTFADARGRYKGNHNTNPADPTNVLDYYFNDNFEHFRVPLAGLNDWVNPPAGIENYLPADHLWIRGDGSVGHEGSYDSDQDAIVYLDSVGLAATENYVFYGRDEDELRVIAGADFVLSVPRWEEVAGGAGGGGVAAPVSLARTGAMPQVLTGNIDWDDIDTPGFYTVTTSAVQVNNPDNTPLGACHVFTVQTYASQIAWTFESSARTFTRTRPGDSSVDFGPWERIHIPINAIVTLLEALAGDERLSITSLKGILPVAMLPSEAMLDSELTAERVRTVLGLTADEVNNLFTGSSILGQVITYTQNDGTVETITIPPGGGVGMADGVVASAALNGNTLVLTLDTGGTVEVDLSILTVGGAAAQRIILKGPTAVRPTNAIQSLELDSSLADAPQNAFVEIQTWHSTSPSNSVVLHVHIQDLRVGAPLVVGAVAQVPSGDELPGVYSARGFRAQSITSFASNAAITLSIGFIDETHIGYASTNVGTTAANSPWDRIRVVVTPLAGTKGDRGLPGQNTIRVQEEETASVDGIETLKVVGSGATIEAVGSVATLTILADGGVTPPVVAHTNYLGIDDDIVWTEAEFTVSGQLSVLVIPAYDGSMHVCFAKPASMGDFTYVYVYGAVRNTDNQITAWMQRAAPLEIGGEDHNLLFSIGALTGAGGLRVEAG